MSAQPTKAWTLPSAEAIPILADALGRALHRPRNRAYARCRRWHRHWHSPMYIANGRPTLDCDRCGMRWIW